MTSPKEHLKKGMLFAHEKILLFIYNWFYKNLKKRKLYLSDIRKSKLVSNSTFSWVSDYMAYKKYITKTKIDGYRDVEINLTDKGLKYCELLIELEKIRK